MDIKRKGILLCLIGPAGSGKTTYCEKLLAAFPNSVSISISATTRQPRHNERNGFSYFFCTHEEFRNKIANGDFYEWQQIHGNLYGTPKQTVDAALASGTDLLLDIDINGALNFKRSLPDNTVILFLTPPSPEELKSRLLARGSISAEDLQIRLSTAEQEFAQLRDCVTKAGLIDYFIVNSEIDLTFQRIVSVLLAERSRLKRLDPSIVTQICKI